MKAKGLGRLRWYCQVCQKQCRDENGFKCHAQSEGHLRAMLVVGEHAGRHVSNYSHEFEVDFMQILSRRYGTKRVKANNVYQELISNKTHTHMNATRWVTLTEFCKYLGRAGKAHVEDSEKGIFITWIDNTPQTLAKQAANQSRERMDLDDEQRQRRLIDQQIERARAADLEANGPVASGSGTSGSDSEPLPSVPSEPIKIGLALKKPPSPDSADAPVPAPAPVKINPLKANPLKSNPLKAGNAFKSGGSASASGAGPHGAKRPASAVEAIMLEDLERKRRRENSTWSGARGHGEIGLQRRD